MPLPGGATDKFGNRYEGRWTVYCLSRILHEEAAAIYLEPVGPEGKGIEFVLTLADGTNEYHQVKRQHSGQGPWSLHNLEAEHILSNFWEKLQTPGNTCVFISASSADQLRELGERAVSAQSADEFRTSFVRANQVNSNFEVLRQKWDGCSTEEAYTALRRVRTETWPEEQLEREVEFRLSSLMDGSAEAAADVLAQLALDSVHQRLYADELWQRLRERGLHRRVLARDPRIHAAVEAANERYLVPLRQQAIFGRPIPRDETQTVLAKLRSAGGKKAVLVSGDAGAGKSGVAAEVIESARAQGWPALAFRMDRLEPVATTRQVGEKMDLPDSPVTVLGSIAQGRDCLLLIDQLDAVSTTSGRNPQFFERVDEMIRQAAIHPRMRMVLLCRRFDLGNDERLRRLTGEKGIADEVTVGHLASETVGQVVSECGLDPGKLSESQKSLLAVPLHLKIFTELFTPGAAASEVATLRFSTLKDLYDLYWGQKQRNVRERMGCAPRWGALLDAAVDRMLRDQALSVPYSTLDDFEAERAALLSEGVLVQDGRRCSFFHETFFDYAFARRFLAQGKRLLPFLRSEEQHLFLRAAVRQVLTHERGEDYNSCLADVGELLTAPDIRFHLKHLTLHLLRALPSPTLGEWEILRPVLGVLGVPGQVVAQAVDAVSVAGQQFLEAFPMPGRGAPGQHFIRKVGHGGLWLPASGVRTFPSLPTSTAAGFIHTSNKKPVVPCM